MDLLPVAQVVALAGLVHAGEVLISVDFPPVVAEEARDRAGAKTSIEMSLIAITLPKYFESFRVSNASSVCALIGSPPSS